MELGQLPPHVYIIPLSLSLIMMLLLFDVLYQ